MADGRDSSGASDPELRFDFDVPPETARRATIQLPLVIAVQGAALCAFGALVFVWKYVGMAEIPAFLRAALGSATVLLGFRLFLPATFAEMRVPGSGA